LREDLYGRRDGVSISLTSLANKLLTELQTTGNSSLLYNCHSTLYDAVDMGLAMALATSSMFMKVRCIVLEHMGC